jgi:LDH2 family malate/lactate/ureidoglycolate dehydrogenase
MAQVRIHHDHLRRLLAGIFAAKGMSPTDAGTVADVLAWANGRGVVGEVAHRPSAASGFFDKRSLAS